MNTQQEYGGMQKKSTLDINIIPYFNRGKIYVEQESDPNTFTGEEIKYGSFNQKAKKVILDLSHPPLDSLEFRLQRVQRELSREGINIFIRNNHQNPEGEAMPLLSYFKSKQR